MNRLRERFTALIRRLGASADATSIADGLLADYAEPGRAYHGTAHLVDCLARLDEVPVPGRDRVEVALWYHDAVYDARAHDNEQRSAERAERELTSLGVERAVAADIARLVRLTDHHALPDDPAGRLLCDIDLSILGRAPPEFDAYDAAIRTEYAWVPDEQYRTARRQVLDDLLRREPIYQTEPFRRRYESQARANLRRAVARLAAGDG